MAGTLAASGGSSNPAVHEKNAGMFHIAAGLDFPWPLAIPIPRAPLDLNHKPLKMSTLSEFPDDFTGTGYKVFPFP
jgi:hypothetical protein